MSKSTKKDAVKKAGPDKAQAAKGSGLSGLEAIKDRLPEKSGGDEPSFCIPTPLTDTVPVEHGARCEVPESDWPSDKKLEACWGYHVGSIGGILNVHLLSNSALPVEVSVVGIIELLQHFTIKDGAIIRHGYPYRNRSECRFPGFFKLVGFPEKGLVSVNPTITSELSNPWWVIKEYINVFRREMGKPEIALQELRESIDSCIRTKTKPAYPPLWNFQFDKTGILKGKTKWYHQKRPGWRYVNVDTRNKRLEGIYRMFSAHNVILWEKF